MQIVALVLRAVQILFGAVVLGLSITLINGQVFGKAPATTSYSAFTGGFGMLAALLGFVAVFVAALDGVIMWAVDALASLFFLAGGIAVAVSLRGVSCSSPNRATLENSLLNGGCIKANNGDKGCAYWPTNRRSTLKSRCQKAEADAAFMFLGFLICVALIGLSFFMRKRNGGRKGGLGV